MPAITDSVQFVKGIGPKKVKLFEKLHISTLQDALETYPRDYEDRTQLTRIADIEAEDKYAVRAVLGTEPRVSRIRKGMTLVKCTIFDESGSLASGRNTCFTAGCRGSAAGGRWFRRRPKRSRKATRIPAVSCRCIR